MSTAPADFPPVTDAPRFTYSGNDNLRLLHQVSGFGQGDAVQVVGDPANGSYEWIIRDDHGKIIRHSQSGYGSVLIALRDGLNLYAPLTT